MGAEAPARAAPDQRGRAGESEATRYLCVGAQIDDDFADRILREVLEERYRAVAPSLGFDLIPVVAHALNASRRHIQRDVVLILVGAVNLVIYPMLSALTALGWLWTRIVYRAVRRRWPRADPRYPLLVAAVAYLAYVPVLLLALLALVVFVRVLRPLVVGPAWFATGPAGVFAWLVRPVAVMLLPVSFMVAWATLLWDRFTRRSLLVQTLRHGSPLRAIGAPADPETHARLAAVSRDQNGSNVTVYSGKFPFVGAGVLSRRPWAFTVDLSRTVDTGDGDGRDDGEITIDRKDQANRIGVKALHEHVAREVSSLRDPDRFPTTWLPDLVVEDRLFVSGGAVHLLPELLPARDQPPVVVARPALIDAVMENPSGPVRHFKCYRVNSWLEETGVSLFLHLAIVGSTLYVERTACELLPIKAEYHIIDRLTNQPLPGETGRLLWLTLKDVPASLLRAPGEFVRLWQLRRQEERSDRILRARIAEHLPIDYGARASIRELAAATTYHNYFQELDTFRHLQAIETRVLAAIEGFLKQHGIDTGEFRARLTFIQNHGVYMPGGTISGSTVAGGPGAQATAAGAPTAP